MHLTALKIDDRLVLELSESGDFTRLTAHSRIEPEDLDHRLQASRIGTSDGEHLWIDETQLRTLGPADEVWTHEFDAMVAYAAQHGWVVDGRVRIHLSADG